MPPHLRSHPCKSYVLRTLANPVKSLTTQPNLYSDWTHEHAKSSLHRGVEADLQRLEVKHSVELPQERQAQDVPIRDARCQVAHLKVGERCASIIVCGAVGNRRLTIPSQVHLDAACCAEINQQLVATTVRPRPCHGSNGNVSCVLGRDDNFRPAAVSNGVAVGADGLGGAISIQDGHAGNCELPPHLQQQRKGHKQ